MAHTLNARIPPRVAQKLAEYCARRGITRIDTVVRALDDYLDRHSGGSDAYALRAHLIPKRGVAKLQSAALRKLARDAFCGSRAVDTGAVVTLINCADRIHPRAAKVISKRGCA